MQQRQFLIVLFPLDYLNNWFSMFYKIQISGGFAGVLQEFIGELAVTEEKKVALKSALNIKKHAEINKNLRDTFNYSIQLEIDNKLYKKTFDDISIPEEIIELIAEVKKKQNL